MNRRLICNAEQTEAQVHEQTGQTHAMRDTYGRNGRDDDDSTKKEPDLKRHLAPSRTFVHIRLVSPAGVMA